MSSKLGLYKLPAVKRMNAAGIGVDRKAGRIAVLAVGQSERPIMSRADDAAVGHRAGAEIGTRVRTNAIDHVNGVVDLKHRQLIAIDIDRLADAVLEFVEIADCGPGHLGNASQATPLNNDCRQEFFKLSSAS